MAADPGSGPGDPGGDPTRAPAPLVVALVNQALDDLEVERLELGDALRLVAEHAWTAGLRAGLAEMTGANGQPAILPTFVAARQPPRGPEPSGRPGW